MSLAPDIAAYGAILKPKFQAGSRRSMICCVTALAGTLSCGSPQAHRIASEALQTPASKYHYSSEDYGLTFELPGICLPVKEEPLAPLVRQHLGRDRTGKALHATYLFTSNGAAILLQVFPLDGHVDKNYERDVQHLYSSPHAKGKLARLPLRSLLSGGCPALDWIEARHGKQIRHLHVEQPGSGLVFTFFAMEKNDGDGLALTLIESISRTLTLDCSGSSHPSDRKPSTQTRQMIEHREAQMRKFIPAFDKYHQILATTFANYAWDGSSLDRCSRVLESTAGLFVDFTETEGGWDDIRKVRNDAGWQHFLNCFHKVNLILWRKALAFGPRWKSLDAEFRELGELRVAREAPRTATVTVGASSATPIRIVFASHLGVERRVADIIAEIEAEHGARVLGKDFGALLRALFAATQRRLGDSAEFSFEQPSRQEDVLFASAVDLAVFALEERTSDPGLLGIRLQQPISARVVIHDSQSAYERTMVGGQDLGNPPGHGYRSYTRISGDRADIQIVPSAQISGHLASRVQQVRVDDELGAALLGLSAAALFGASPDWPDLDSAIREAAKEHLLRAVARQGLEIAMLASDLTHELIHAAFAATASTQRPWLMEGVATYFGERVAALRVSGVFASAMMSGAPPELLTPEVYPRLAPAWQRLTDATRKDAADAAALVRNVDPGHSLLTEREVRYQSIVGAWTPEARRKKIKVLLPMASSSFRGISEIEHYALAWAVVSAVAWMRRLPRQDARLRRITSRWSAWSALGDVTSADCRLIDDVIVDFLERP